MSATLTKTDQLIDFVAGSGQIMSTTEIVGAMASRLGSSEASIKNTLSRLVDSGRLHRVSHGAYVSPISALVVQYSDGPEDVFDGIDEAFARSGREMDEFASYYDLSGEDQDALFLRAGLPTRGDLEAISDFLSIPLEFLAHGDRSNYFTRKPPIDMRVPQQPGNPAHPNRVSGASIAYPLVDTRPGEVHEPDAAAPPEVVLPRDVVSAWADGLVPGKEDAYFTYVDGEENEPWLRNGESVFVIKCSRFTGGGRYFIVIGDDDFPLVRRIDRKGKNIYLMKTGNPEHSDFRVRHVEGDVYEDLENGGEVEIRVVGKIIRPTDTGQAMMRTVTKQMGEVFSYRNGE